MSPEMVRRELWTTFLTYNLIRTTIATAAWEETQVPPTWVSFYLASRAGVGTTLLTPIQPLGVGRCCKKLLCASEEGIHVS